MGDLEHSHMSFEILDMYRDISYDLPECKEGRTKYHELE